jgi:nucleoside diphosphate kinase
MNRSIYIIKPEAMPFREEIRKMICLAGLKIIRTTEAIIPIDVLDKLYTDCSDELRRATQLFMGCEPCEIGEVIGENAVEKLLSICGHVTDPSQCAAQTIRNRFGVRQVEHFENALYFKNAIHRPKNAEEAQRDLNALSKIFNSQKAVSP